MAPALRLPSREEEISDMTVLEQQVKVAMQAKLDG